MICLGYVLFSPAYLAQDHCLPIISLPSSLPFWTCSSHPSLEHDHLTHFFLPLFLQVIAVQCHPTMAVSHTIASSAGATLQLTCFTYCRNKVKGTERNCRVRATGKVRTEKKKSREESQEPEKVACLGEKWVAPGTVYLGHNPPCFWSWHMHSILTTMVRSDNVLLQAEGKGSSPVKGVRRVSVYAYPAALALQDYSKNF